MVEPIMYLAIGFLISTLLGLMVVPLVHNRAVRLTTKRLEAATPLSMAEIQADKDQLRAEFAIAMRRLEMTVEQLRNTTTSQLAELGKKTDAINRLKLELSEKSAAIFTLETREKALHEEQRTTAEELESKSRRLHVAEQELADKQAALAKLSSELSDRTMAAESRQVELVALRSQIESLQHRAAGAEKDFTATRQRLDEQRGASETTARELAEARGQVESLSARLGELDRQLAARVKKTETLAGRITDLESRLAQQGKLLVERDHDNELVRQQLEAAKETEHKLRQEIASSAGPSAAMDMLRAEKTTLQEQLAAAREEGAKLQRETDLLRQQQAESTHSTEHAENALLREHINDIAAEVARLAVTLEGSDSAIETMLASDAQRPAISAIVNGSAARTMAAPPAGTAAVAAGEARGTLAERIRALKAQTARARRPG
jgi:chromosome segregation ATPase